MAGAREIESGVARKHVDRRVEGGLQRGRAIEILVDGSPVPAFEGESVAAALLAAGTRVLRITARYGTARGLYCGMGVCFECVMTVDGRPNARTCQTPVRENMRVETQQGEGQWSILPEFRS
ncbi:MAG: (2Fe-2S)-binding protein [Thermoanaerobaculia bacterium]